MTIVRTNIKYWVIAIGLLMALSFVTFLANVFFTVQNEELSSDVSNFFDEKASLRAKFLTHISASNLTDQADIFHMVQVSNNHVQTVNRKKPQTIKRESAFDPLFTALSSEDSIVSGY